MTGRCRNTLAAIRCYPDRRQLRHRCKRHRRRKFWPGRRYSPWHYPCLDEAQRRPARAAKKGRLRDPRPACSGTQKIRPAQSAQTAAVLQALEASFNRPFLIVQRDFTSARLVETVPIFFWCSPINTDCAVQFKLKQRARRDPAAVTTLGLLLRAGNRHRCPPSNPW
jgi:hypothetical protein